VPNKEYLITLFKICQFFVLTVNFWAFWWKQRNSTANSYKMMVH